MLRSRRDRRRQHPGAARRLSRRRRSHDAHSHQPGAIFAADVGRAARPLQHPRLSRTIAALAPLLRLEIWKCLARLKAEGRAILVVDKHLAALLKLADRHAIIEKGQVVWSGTSAALAADPTITQRYLQV